MEDQEENMELPQGDPQKTARLIEAAITLAGTACVVAADNLDMDNPDAEQIASVAEDAQSDERLQTAYRELAVAATEFGMDFIKEAFEQKLDD